MKDHKHPLSGDIVRGVRLLSGDVLRDGDVYASASGRWETCPCAGVMLERGHEVPWVRPLELAKEP